MNSVRCSGVASMSVGVVACMALLTTPLNGQTCRPASGSQIGAPPFAQEGTTINYSFTLTIADLPGACAAIVTDVDFFTPDIFSTGGGDPCDNEGLELPHSNQLLNPGDLLRFSAVDTGMPNCAAASDVNCEIVVPGLVYIVDPADVVNDALPVSGCWEGLAQPGNFTVTASQEVETTFLNPDIDVEKFADITRVCEGQDTDVTYSYTVTTGAGDVAINNISATDDTCGPLVRGDDTPGNNDNTLELGEVWNFTCNDTIDGETTNTVTVTGNDVILGRTVSDTDVLTITANPAECEIDPPFAAICEGDPGVEFCAIALTGDPPFSFSWTGPGGFTATTECITVDVAGEYCATVTDANGCESVCCATLEVNENPACTIDVGPCPFPRTVTVNPTGGRPPYTFLWNTGETTQSISVGAPGTFSVTVTDDNGCVGTCEALVEECDEGEGCTPGYWKQPHHFDDWTDPFDPDDLFSDHFEDAFPGKTLLEVLSQPASTPPGPNALNSLGRHTVAAVLNAASGGVDFDFSVQEVIEMFNEVFPGSDEDYTELKNIFAAANEQGCPLNGNSDATADGLVNTQDLAALLSNWGGKGAGDVNQDGVVDSADLAQMLANWGA